MDKIKSCAIIFNKKGELLMQKRDEEPEIGKWVLFGGGVDVGETEKSALQREIKEELGYELKNVSYFGEYEDNGIKQVIFVIADPVEMDELKLYEGSEMKFFSAKNLESLDIGFNFRRIISDYLNQ